MTRWTIPQSWILSPFSSVIVISWLPSYLPAVPSPIPEPPRHSTLNHCACEFQPKAISARCVHGFVTICVPRPYMHISTADNFSETQISNLISLFAYFKTQQPKTEQFLCSSGVSCLRGKHHQPQGSQQWNQDSSWCFSLITPGSHYVRTASPPK